MAAFPCAIHARNAKLIGAAMTLAIFMIIHVVARPRAVVCIHRALACICGVRRLVRAIRTRTSTGAGTTATVLSNSAVRCTLGAFEAIAGAVATSARAISARSACLVGATHALAVVVVEI